MSRSKRLEIYKDARDKYYNKRHRRVNKILINKGKEPKNTSEITNDYDVRDYKFAISYTKKVRK